MLTRNHKIGLVLAFLLGLSDIAILGALGGDNSSDKPPIAIVVPTVAVGLITLVLVVMAWRKPVRPLMIAVIALRVLSGLGSIGALGVNTFVTILSVIFIVLTIIDIYLLSSWIRKPSPVS
ncbi:MAG: hypothetical protein WKF86_08660 [Acidimicrobiales bacterium]